MPTTPIRRRLMTALLLTSGVVMLITSSAFCAYDFLTYRQQTQHNLATLGDAIAANSTAALAFQNPDDAREVLSALHAESHIVDAILFTSDGTPFASYPARRPAVQVATPPPDGYRFEGGYLIGVQPVVQGQHRMGSLYLKADLNAVYERLRSFVLIAALVMVLTCAAAYLLATRLQKQISQPILAFAKAVADVSSRQDYTLHVRKPPGHELGVLADSFNNLLVQVERAHSRLQSQLGRLDLLHRITRAIGERQDLPSIFQVLLAYLEAELPIDFGCIALCDPSDAQAVRIVTIGIRSQSLAERLAIDQQPRVPIGQNGLARCVAGELVYEPDVGAVDFPFPQRFARAGILSVVLAPLLVQKRVFGVLIVGRRAAQAFNSTDCEFLRHLSEHVALATHQTQLYSALQQAYDDVRQSQHAILQQERLRALGQMASGIAHDINNAISPIALYTESLLEREPGLSDRTRTCLVTIQRAIEDVAETVSRMREFYRMRAPEMNLSRVSLNRLIEQVVELTHARWSDLPMQRGVVITLQPNLASDLPDIMGSETEIRDALTNLVFNAVDAMPEGGTLVLRTRFEHRDVDSQTENAPAVHVEVSDTGVGMDEETRRRCLEPFYTTKGERGTGLGLAMVYGMIQRHSAELNIDSVVGQGTTVRLSFIPAQASLMTAQQAPVEQATRRLRLLLVDDDPLLLKSIKEVLDADGHSVVAADGGQNGIDTFQTAHRSGQPFSLVITDLGMPYVDGRKVAAAVKAESPQTPVILLTGWGRRLIAENDTPPHVDRILSKPPKLAALRATLTELTTDAASVSPTAREQIS
jgi:signal transduction histidine kinase/CheY-like chemotaxis protein